MTRPIYEPSTDRSLASQGWGQRQLFRRPAPQSCPCPVDAAIAYDSASGGGTGTVSNNTNTQITFDEFSLAADTQAFAADQGAGTSRPFKAILDGWYIGYINFEWSGGVFADVRTYVLYSNLFPQNAGSQNMVKSEPSPFINAAFNGTYGPFYIRAAELGSGWFRTRVQHAAGSTQTITGVLMTVVYLGADLEPGRFPIT